MNEAHRESCQRQHRIVGHYLAVQAWIRSLDCIVLERNDLEKLLGLERFKGVRVKWLLEDIAPWFRHSYRINYKGKPNSIASLFLSRYSIKEHIPSGTMSTRERLKRMAKDAPRTEVFSKRLKDIPTPAEMVAFLSILDAGLDIPDTKIEVKRMKK